MKNNKFFFTLVFFVLFTFSLFAKPEFADYPETIPQKPADRPSVALVLAGGGAKGFAHLPLLELIEELDIPIDMIIGTSIGSIIGGLYSAGYTPEKIYDEFTKVDWVPIFNDYTISSYESVLGEHSLLANPVNINFADDLTLKLGKGLSGGQKCYQMLRNYTVKYPSNLNFDDLQIPFRAVVTDIQTGEAMLLKNGDLAEAIRSSMSLPAVFEPFEVDGYNYMDGGLRYNVAINVAKNMGYDIIIAIDISPKLDSNVENYSSNPAVAIVNMITIAQATLNNSLYEDADIVVLPELDEYSILDFKNYEKIYKKGEEAAEQYRSQFENLRKRIYPADYDSAGKRISKLKERAETGKYESVPNLVPTELEIYGAFNNDINYIQSSFNKIKNQEFNEKNLDSFLLSLYLTGNYKRIRPRLIKNDDKVTMQLLLDQENPKSFKVVFGGDYKQTVSTSSSTILNLYPEIQIRGFTGIGSLVAIRGSFINDFGGSLFYFQPFSPSFFIEVETALSQKHFSTLKNISHSDYKILVYNSEMASFNTWKTNLDFGIRVKTGGVFKTGLFYNYQNFETKTLLMDSYFNKHLSDDEKKKHDIQEGSSFGISFKYTLDKMDRIAFPHSGYFYNTENKLLIPFIDDELPIPALVTSHEIRVANPLTNKSSVVFSGFGGADIFTNLSGNYQLLDTEFFNSYDRAYFPQIVSSVRHGTYKFATSVTFQLEPWDALTILGGEAFLFISNTLGNIAYDIPSLIMVTEEARELFPILWSSSLGIGVKLKEAYSIMLRFGLGSTYMDKVAPFVTFDIGAFRF